MDRTVSQPRIMTLATGSLVAAFAIVALAAAVLGAPPAPSAPAPSAPIGGVPTPAPTATPQPTATPTASPSQPVDHPPILGDVTIDLEVADGHRVKATVRDTTKSIIAIRSGQPGGGMSVRWHDILVRQLDVHTVSVVWVGLPIDDQVHIDVAFENSVYLIEIVQVGPEPGTDATGVDREIILSFDQPVVAADILGGVADRTVD